MSGEQTARAVFRAALDLQAFCEDRGWRFCIIDALLGRFAARRADAREFAIRTRVVLLRHESGVELDVALGALDFEARAIERGSWWVARPGVRLFTCSAEDLVVHKAFASREQDWADVDRILAVQGGRLKVEQILVELRPLAELKEDAGIVPKLEGMLRKRGLRA